MDRETLADRYAGCMAGAAHGDALGMPANGLSTYRVRKLFQRLDGFFPCPRTLRKEGTYTGVTQIMMLAAAAAEKGMDLPAAMAAVKEKGQARWTNPADDWLLAPLHIGLRAAAHPIPDPQLLKDCAAVLRPLGASRPACLASFSICWCVKELIRNGPVMKSRTDLSFADHSMTARLALLCKEIESNFEPGEDDGDKFWLRIEEMRKKFDAAASIDAAATVLGCSSDYREAVPFSLFCFLTSPTDMKSLSWAAGMGGAASLNAAITGAFVGAYSGVGFIQDAPGERGEGYAKIVEYATHLAQNIAV